MALHHVVYLHGYMSSDLSYKGQSTHKAAAAFPSVKVHTPCLSDYPRQAMQQMHGLIDDILEQSQPVGLIGSSLGGFYAHYLAECYGLSAVLINPAVEPYDLLSDMLGVKTNPYTHERVEHTAEHMDHLRALERPVTGRSRLQVRLQTGDETLDYKNSVRYFEQSDVRVEQGGDHAFQGYAEQCPEIIRFLLASGSAVDFA
ncbi:YqiA/YcfP family alpha/beta fold hydrolase [Echinimonas agarilytica]|uniref:Esterase YqiA n=1 Tax=Echinimonas agarilytica TaxID=1215918 RepID=A0AA42B820_9GAMM|nr:YqiA/YcfP family alpha/beta fold hydrolase [Echinimonas agarilytica]MCM2680394.1 esterase YqiA [Echinimonas agarilytica]